MSNFNLEQLQTVVKSARILPAVNQVRLNSPQTARHPSSPSFPQISFNPYNYAQHKDLLAYAAKHGIVIEAYSSLACVPLSPPARSALAE